MTTMARPSRSPFGPLAVIADPARRRGPCRRSAPRRGEGDRRTRDRVPVAGLRQRDGHHPSDGRRSRPGLPVRGRRGRRRDGPRRRERDVPRRPSDRARPRPRGHPGPLPVRPREELRSPERRRRRHGASRGGGDVSLRPHEAPERLGRGEQTVRYAHNLAQIGFHAEATARTARLPERLGNARRFLGFWGAYVRTRPVDLAIDVDGRAHALRGWSLVIGNGQFADGGLRLSPRSFPGDGVMDTLVFTGPKSDAYRMLPRISATAITSPTRGSRS